MEALRANDPRRIGPYEVLGRLGAGGMGEVYLAEGQGGPRLAVKVVRAEHAEDRTFRARFRQEVRAAQSIGGAGPYTARVVDADTEAERPWMATEFVEGPNLRDAVLDHGALPDRAVRLLAAALGEALAAIHAKGMVHRDLKPSNILLAPDGPRVIDFGIVRALEATALTNTGAVVGSVGYVSPEQIRNGAEVGPPSDVFSLGAVLAYAAAGREPFGEGQDSVILLRILTRDFDLSGVPDGLRPLVESCLAEDPAARLAPAGVPEAAGHTTDTLREGLRPGWYLAPEPVAETERWLPERDSGERESRVEYVAPMTVTEVTDVPDVTADTSAQTAERPSRRGVLRVLVGGAVVAAGAGTGGWLWLRDRSGEDPSGGAGGVPGTSVSSDRSSGATLPPGVSWTYDVGGLGGRAGGRHGACVALSPAGDRVYVGGADGSLHAVSPAGKKLWAVDLGAPVMPPVATADGAYCLLEDDGEGASKLCAVSRYGRIRWTKKIDGGGSQFPVTAGDFVLVTTGATSDKGTLRAYASGGGLVWEKSTDAAPTSEPAVGNGMVYVGTFGDVVQAFGLMDGRLRWSVPAGVDPGRPTLIGGTLLVGSGGETLLHAISTSGRLLWSADNDDAGGGRYFTSVRLGDLAVTTDQGRLAAIDPVTGRTKWAFESPQGGTDHSDPTVVGNSVYACLDGVLYSVDATGKQRRRLSFGDPEPDGGVHSPVIKDGLAYVATAEGIAALKL
ncbi:serine/threonine-protein kinase [Streptomyces cylindrosporus]|uniref:Serine/threonine-protein kinase n=1 Tax=Streptomyces cylindrosporus TaxID=2927583 RepID=A0ABS9XZB3_9ACTN|nr:serine/threonine-protein kinase [Streptomyces cylindrosporus]MCI3270292.1 serine/threonine-protein kinase [Streptomyces cylindrosporus]